MDNLTQVITAKANAETLSATDAFLAIITRGRAEFPLLVNNNDALKAHTEQKMVNTVSTTQAATDANLNEKDLWTYSLPANSLNVDGKGVRITVWGTTAANANNKTVKVYFGATAVCALSFTTSGAHWRCEAVVIRTGATAQLATGDVEVALGSQQNVVTTPAETLASAVTIKCTGQNGSASANDIVFRGAVVELLA